MFLEGISSFESYITKQGKKWGICWQFYHGKKVEESCWNLCGGANLLSSCLFPAFVKRVELSLSHSFCGVAPRGDFRVTETKKTRKEAAEPAPILEVAPQGALIGEEEGCASYLFFWAREIFAQAMLGDRAGATMLTSRSFAANTPLPQTASTNQYWKFRVWEPSFRPNISSRAAGGSARGQQWKGYSPLSCLV